MSHPLNSTYDKRLQEYYNFDVPDDDRFFHQDINTRRYQLLVLAALSHLAGMATGACTQEGGIPLNVPVAVTDEGVTLAAVADVSRKVGVWNNGESALILLEGDSLPGFAGQDTGNGALAVDFGLILAPGEYFESPVAHKGLIRARSRDDESTTTTVTLY